MGMERIRNIEQEFIKLEKEEDEAAAKKKVVKKKKKNKKVNEDPVEAPPKINLLAGDITNVRSVFEKNKKQVDHIKEPLKPVRINKLTVNPFEHLNTSEPTVEKEIKVSKLQKNSFIEKLEKKGNVPIEPAAKPGTKMIPSKKSSGETCIKFESKKERKPIEEHDTKCERKQEVRVSKSIEAPHPVNKDIKQKKSGSSRSLHKIFIEGPKEFFKSSKEKLYKISKETLCEVNEKNEKCEEHKIEAKKPSRSGMQNYLLSHVLFDGKEVTKKDKIPPKKDI